MQPPQSSPIHTAPVVQPPQSSSIPTAPVVQPHRCSPISAAPSSNGDANRMSHADYVMFSSFPNFFASSTIEIFLMNTILINTLFASDCQRCYTL
jgi:hypothetical protein